MRTEVRTEGAGLGGPDGEHGVEVWSSAGWRERAVAWLDERLTEAGTARTGEVEQPHLRPWATALRVPTRHGPVWLKAAAPGTAFEVGLYGILHRVAPGRVPAPLAADVARGWIVLPDGGPALAERLGGADLVDALEAALPQYGQLQRDLAPLACDLLAMGVADMRPAALPGRFAEALDAVAGFVERRGSTADRAALRRVAGLGATYAAWCERLAASPVPASLDHNDLHPWNILGPGMGASLQAVFYDWGDSVVAHPFASMLVPLGFARSGILRTGPDDPRILRLRDAYLEGFGDLAPHAALVEELELACRVGKVARALTWQRAVVAMGSDDDEGFARAPLETLLSLPSDSYLGGA